VRSRFRTKILFLFGGLIAAMQAATVVGVVGMTREDAMRRTSESLRVGAAVFRADLADREAKLVDRVHLLSRDFAFVEAVSTLDASTLQSVLRNHGARARADLALLLSADGTILASSAETSSAAVARPVAELLDIAEAQGRAVAIVVHEGAPYQVVAMPVYAPRPIAWLCMGFVVDDAVARAVKRKTHLEVSFFAHEPTLDAALLASTLPLERRAGIADALRTLPEQEYGHEEPFLLGGSDYLTVAIALTPPPLPGAPRGVPLYAAIQTSMGQALEGQRGLQASLLALTLAALAAASLLAAWIARSVAHPIQALVAAAQRISAGDYTRPVELSSSDELGVLARSMNDMQAEISAREEQLVYQTSHDPLTGLYSRAVVHERIHRAIERARKTNGCFALLLVSIDRFKEINDKFGHPIGDRVLRQIAATLLSERVPSDTVVRLGGDEFLLILGDSDADPAQREARCLARKLGPSLKLDQLEIPLELSIGVSVYPEHGDQSEVLLRRADIALLSAKRDRHEVRLYEPGQDEEHLRKLAILSSLPDALERGELLLLYQPKMNVRTREVMQAEVLLRWTSPQHGTVRPDELIPWAEESGQISQITRWVLGTAIAQCGAWHRRGLHVAIAVNLSGRDLADEDLPEHVLQRLTAHGAPASSLVLEVTETTAMQDLETAKRVIDGFREHGIRIALDDFGTGHSSLAQLKQLALAELKIDRSFTRSLKDSDPDTCIVRFTTEIGHSLGMTVVAEGVEDGDCLERLAALGVDFAQGYYISRPLPAADLEAWIEEYYREQMPPESYPG
jgi:diguanylate cyclase (GGDEF)-like protein